MGYDEVIPCSFEIEPRGRSSSLAETPFGMIADQQVVARAVFWASMLRVLRGESPPRLEELTTRMGVRFVTPSDPSMIEDVNAILPTLCDPGVVVRIVGKVWPEF